MGHGRDRTKVPKKQQLALSSQPIQIIARNPKNGGEAVALGRGYPQNEGWLNAECYRAELAAIFFTMASTSLRSLSLRLTL